MSLCHTSGNINDDQNLPLPPPAHPSTSDLILPRPSLVTRVIVRTEAVTRTLPCFQTTCSSAQRGTSCPTREAETNRSLYCSLPRTRNLLIGKYRELSMRWKDYAILSSDCKPSSDDTRMTRARGFLFAITLPGVSSSTHAYTAVNACTSRLQQKPKPSKCFHFGPFRRRCN